MSLGAISAFLLVLVGVFIFGTLWFHLIESLLGRIKRLFTRSGDGDAWHSLPTDQADDRDV